MVKSEKFSRLSLQAKILARFDWKLSPAEKIQICWILIFLRISINVALLVVTKSGVRKIMRRGKHSSDIHMGEPASCQLLL